MTNHLREPGHPIPLGAWGSVLLSKQQILYYSGLYYSIGAIITHNYCFPICVILCLPVCFTSISQTTIVFKWMCVCFGCVCGLPTWLASVFCPVGFEYELVYFTSKKAAKLNNDCVYEYFIHVKQLFSWVLTKQASTTVTKTTI